jgi:hypothetical protein
MEITWEIIEDSALQTCVPTCEGGFCYHELGVADCPAARLEMLVSWSAPGSAGKNRDAKRPVLRSVPVSA